ncbi:MAG: restriction endonuclease subunit S [Sterolibacteriaceae bacterium MAG5]|nr:restriction endonuclease subunit S [Candidatus Nitricoxidireducens bremensis]
MGEIAQITSGGTPDRSEPSYWNGTIPWVTTGEIQFNTITDTAEKITEAGLKNSSAKRFPPGTLLMAMYGQGKTRGQVAKLGTEATTNQNSAAILLGDSFDPDFYFHFLSWQYESIREFGHSGGISHLNAGLLKQISVPVAPEREQKKIAAVLATWNEAIAATERLLTNSRKQKRALMQSLIVRRSRSAATWRHCHLREVANRIQRDSDGSKHPILMISSGSGFVRQDEKYSRFMAGKSLDDYILLKKGEFAYNKGNSKLYEFGCIFPLEDYAQGLVPHVYVCFSLSDECNPAFFKHLFEADYLHDQLGALVNTGVRNNGLLNIRPADFMNVRIPVPPMDEQHAIAKVLDVATAEIALRERELAALQQQKRALMQQLLTGKRRVRVPASEATP